MPDREPGAPRARRLFVTSLGIGQIMSWGSLYYSFPLIAGPMERELGLSRPEIYGAASLGLLVASIASFPVGAAIDRGRGRAVMTLGSIAAGLLLIGWSQVTGLWSLYLLFAGIGLIQAMTLYDAAFAVAARRFGPTVRDAITKITLFAGFSSTIFVPLIQAMLDLWGWRDALVALGLMNLLLCAAIHAWAIDPRADLQAAEPRGRRLAGWGAVRWALFRPVFWGLLVAFTAYFATFFGFSFHLYPMLLERGLDATAAVAAIALIGPAQVGGRVIAWLIAGRRPIRVIGAVVVAAFPLSFALLLLVPQGFVAVAAFALLFGAANGIMTIVRGVAVPEMLTRQAYGAINGALAVPIFLAQAAAPLAAAALWEASGGYRALLVACVVGSLVICLGFWFAALAGRRGPAD